MWDLIVSVPDHCLSFYFVHSFRDNAVTGDIPLISLVLESMVPP